MPEIWVSPAHNAFLGNGCGDGCRSSDLIDKFAEIGLTAHCLSCEWNSLLDDQCIATTYAGKRCRKTAVSHKYCSVHEEIHRLDFAREWSHFYSFKVDAEQWKRSTEVYFIKAGDYVKIGYSKNPAQRLKTLSKANDSTVRPADCDLSEAKIVGTVAGGHELESHYHRLARDWHVCGEWYAWNEELETIVREAVRSHGITEILTEP